MLIGMFKLTASQSVSHGPSRRSLMLFLLHRNTKPPNKPAVFLSFFSRLSRARARVKWLSKQQLRKERERERELESGREGCALSLHMSMARCVRYMLHALEGREGALVLRVSPFLICYKTKSF
jgi:hypothetical protein